MPTFPPSWVFDSQGPGVGSGVTITIPAGTNGTVHILTRIHYRIWAPNIAAAVGFVIQAQDGAVAPVTLDETILIVQAPYQLGEIEWTGNFQCSPNSALAVIQSTALPAGGAQFLHIEGYTL